jgi:diadenosine tetraphosphatase ApaH/serine/threonine PP2A family protein phosphatase
MAGCKCGARGLPRTRRQPSRARKRVVTVGVLGGAHCRDRHGSRRFRRIHCGSPPSLYKPDTFGTDRVSGDDEAGAGLMGAKNGHVPGMCVRRAWLVEVVIAVVPYDNKTEAAHGRPDRAASANGTSNRAARQLQKTPVSLRRSQVRGECDVTT